MTTHLIGIGGLQASSTAGSSVKTLALGSCVALVVLDPRTHAVGLAHVALPEAALDKEKAASLPGYFADTAVPALLEEMARLGVDPRGKGLIVKLAGGASIVDPANTFNIGKRNVLSLKKTLWKYGLGPLAEDVGGDWSRTVEVFVDTGLLRITSPGRPTMEI